MLPPELDGPVVTFVTISFVTATDAPPSESTADIITVDVSVIVPLPTTTGTSSTLSSSLASPFASPTSDSTVSNSTTSDPLGSGASNSISLSNVILASETLAAPTASTRPVSLNPEASSPGLSIAGTISIAVVLSFLVVAIIVLFCCYRRTKNSHKEAMLIAPRFLRRNSDLFLEAGDESLHNLRSGGNSFDADIKSRTAHPESIVTSPYLNHGVSFTKDKDISDYQSESAFQAYFLRTTKFLDFSEPVNREHRCFESSIHGVRYNSDGSLAFDYEPTQPPHSAARQTPPGWDETHRRLNALHQLTPPPLNIVKRKALNPGSQIQPPARTLRHSAHSSLESIYEKDPSCSLRERDSTRAAALAKLEGQSVDLFNRYTSDSVYSRTLDGIPLDSAKYF